MPISNRAGRAQIRGSARPDFRLESAGASTRRHYTFGVLKDVEPDLILMDIQLPGMDGWELTGRLKKNIYVGDELALQPAALPKTAVFDLEHLPPCGLLASQRLPL